MNYAWLYTDLLQALKEDRLSSVFSPGGTLISASAAPHCGVREREREHFTQVRTFERRVPLQRNEAKRVKAVQRMGMSFTCQQGQPSGVEHVTLQRKLCISGHVHTTVTP